MKTEKLTLDTAAGKMNVHLHHPHHSTDKPIPAIIVLQEAFGVNKNIQAICVRFAQQGFLAVAPELFHRQGNDLQISYSDYPAVMKTLETLSTEGLAEDVKVTFDHLKQNKALNVGSVGIIGFCMGGFTSILGACRNNLNFAISCYGGGLTQARQGIGFTPFIEEFNQINCPLFLLFGEKDNSIPLEQVEEVRMLLKRAQKEYEIKVYRGAGHAFLREGEKTHHAEAAKEAWKDIDSWLKLHVK